MSVYVTIIPIYKTGELQCKIGDIVTLVKEPDNPVDDECIAVVDKNNEKIGYVANSVNTVARGTWSAGRLYDKIGKAATATVKFMVENVQGIVEIDFSAVPVPTEPESPEDEPEPETPETETEEPKTEEPEPETPGNDTEETESGN